MVATGHSAVGFGIGVLIIKSALIQDPFIASGVCLMSAVTLHYLEDFIPHGHFITNPDKIAKSPITYLDVIFGAGLFTLEALLVFGFSVVGLIVLFAIGGSLLPDVISALFSNNYHNPPKNHLAKLEYRLHNFVHWHGTGKNTLPIGWYDVWQLAVILIAILLPFWI